MSYCIYRIGDKGELLVRTGTMTGGYHNNLTKSASAFADGWLVLCIDLIAFVNKLVYKKSGIFN